MIFRSPVFWSAVFKGKGKVFIFGVFVVGKIGEHRSHRDTESHKTDAQGRATVGGGLCCSKGEGRLLHRPPRRKLSFDVLLFYYNKKATFLQQENKNLQKEKRGTPRKFQKVTELVSRVLYAKGAAIIYLHLPLPSSSSHTALPPRSARAARRLPENQGVASDRVYSGSMLP